MSFFNNCMSVHCFNKLYNTFKALDFLYYLYRFKLIQYALII